MEQRTDPELTEIIRYLSDCVRPEDKHACELALTKFQYSVADRVLYHVRNDGTIWIIPPAAT